MKLLLKSPQLPTQLKKSSRSFDRTVFVLFLYATATNCVRSVAQTNDDDDGMREKIQPGDEPRTPLSSTQIELALLGSSRIDSIGIIEN